MNWEEAQQAFKKQVPVVYTGTRESFRCARIAELTLRRTKDGELHTLVGAMDHTEKCLYVDAPERFELAEK